MTEQNDLCNEKEPCINCRVESLEIKMRVLGLAILITGLFLAYKTAGGFHGK